jgi:hypothetical protein
MRATAVKRAVVGEPAEIDSLRPLARRHFRLEPSQKAMAKYMAHVDEEGVVLCYDADLREQMETGRCEGFNSR